VSNQFTTSLGNVCLTISSYKHNIHYSQNNYLFLTEATTYYNQLSVRITIIFFICSINYNNLHSL